MKQSEDENTPSEPRGDALSAEEQLRAALAQAEAEIARLRRLLAAPILAEERAILRDALDEALRGAPLQQYRLTQLH